STTIWNLPSSLNSALSLSTERQLSRSRRTTTSFPATFSSTQKTIIFLWRSAPTNFMASVLLWRQLEVRNELPTVYHVLKERPTSRCGPSFGASPCFHSTFVPDNSDIYGERSVNR